MAVTIVSKTDPILGFLARNPIMKNAKEWLEDPLKVKPVWLRWIVGIRPNVGFWCLWLVPPVDYTTLCVTCLEPLGEDYACATVTKNMMVIWGFLEKEDEWKNIELVFCDACTQHGTRATKELWTSTHFYKTFNE